jgi:predicted transposase/invertase (TIGR01784 family)
MLKRDYENIILTDKYELHYIQLSKFKKKCKRISTKLEQWLLFIINENMEEINMVDNKYVKKAEKELEYLSGDEETRRLAELREKAIRDELAAIAQARDEGKSEGFSLGKSEGESQNTIKIAKKMLEKQIDIALIMEITGLTKEEIEKL